MPPPTTSDVAGLIAALLNPSSISGTQSPESVSSPLGSLSMPTSPNMRLLDEMLSAIITSLRADLPQTPSENVLNLSGNVTVLAQMLDVSSGPPEPATTKTAASDTGLIPSSATQLPKRVARKKRYADAAPSTHCHVCCRLTNTLPKAVCRNIRDGTCRKVVCRRCINEHGWDWQCASVTPNDWICPHCIDECGTVRAHCWVYKKTNTRRKMNGLRNKGRRNTSATLPPLRVEPATGNTGQAYTVGNGESESQRQQRVSDNTTTAFEQ